MKYVSITILILFSLCLTLPVVAQEGAGTIEFGQTVTGEITNQGFEIPYTFEGQSGDVVIVEMAAVDSLGDLNLPALILLDSDMSMMGSTYGFSDVILAAKLPADGAYTILATRDDGRAGESVGEFTLSLKKPPVLVLNEPMLSSITSDGADYFVVELSGGFKVNYEKTAGDFYPAVSVQRVTGDYTLEEAALMEGESLVAGMLGIEAGSSLASDTFLVVVKEGMWDFNYNPVSADYTVTLTQ